MAKADKKNYRSQVSKWFNEIGNIEEMEAIELETKMSLLAAAKARLNEITSQLAQYHYDMEAAGKKDPSAAVEGEVEGCEPYVMKISELEIRYRKRFRVLQREGKLESEEPSIQIIEKNNDKTFLKPPQIPLPSFNSGPEEDYTLFIKNFEQTLSKHGLSSYDKFVLLKK